MGARDPSRRASLRVALAAIVATLTAAGTAMAAPASSPVTVNGAITILSTTNPGNGDQNPYGVSVVPASVGKLVQGQVLVSNFNNDANQQGTGTTIVGVDPTAQTEQLFAAIDPSTAGAHCPGGIGLTTALVALHSGYVVVGSLPSADGMPDQVQPGCLLVLDPNGNVVQTISGPGIDGPWDMAAQEQGNRLTLFVSNVLNGLNRNVANPVPVGQVVNQGSVTRLQFVVGHGHGNVLPPLLEFSRQTIASGFPEKLDPAALVIGETGLGLSTSGTLYVADTLDNAIVAVPNALRRQTAASPSAILSQGGALNLPLGLVVAPNGDIVTVNAGDGNEVVTSPQGAQLSVATFDPANPGGGTLFGLALAPDNGVYFSNDGSNTLNLFQPTD